MKFGMNTPTIQNVITNKMQNDPNLTQNAAGGMAFNTDPSTKLLTMAGGNFFNEPTYYSVDSKNQIGLTGQAKELVDTARMVAGSETGKDILQIAHFLRAEKNLRTTPAVLYAIAAGVNNTRENMVEYGPKILKRPDDVLQAFAAFLALFGTMDVKNGKVTRKAVFPNSFKKGLAAALSKFDEYQLLKWDSNSWPRLKDVIRVVDRKKGYPLSYALIQYLNTGEVINPEETPILAARKELRQRKTWNAQIPMLAEKSHVTWEELLSQFGNKKEVWEALIDGGKKTLPVMAAIRNLRNMEQSGISNSHWSKLQSMVMSYEDTKMLPYRFIAARKNITTAQAKSISDLMLDKACNNIPDLEGETIIIVDHSGSMHSAMSNKSEMMRSEAATALAAVLTKKFGSKCRTFVFGTNHSEVQLSQADSAYRMYEEIFQKGRTVGESTYAGKVMNHLVVNNIKADRIILLSDMQCYTHYSKNEFTVQFAMYRAKVNNNAKLISVDVGGYGTAVSNDSNVLLSTGWNEGIINEILAFEGATEGGEVVSATPSLDYVRSNY